MCDIPVREGMLDRPPTFFFQVGAIQVPKNAKAPGCRRRLSSQFHESSRSQVRIGREGREAKLGKGTENL